MISLATLVMVAWIPIILVSFSLLPPRRAVITAYIVGWLFLPILGWNLPGLPLYDKTTATNLGVLVAILLFDLRTVLGYRPSLVDLPVLVLCLSSIPSAVSNGLGIFEGISGAWGTVVTWGVPWLVGRCYFGTFAGLRELAIGMFVGAVAYIPLCLFEMNFGAILHERVYGYYQHGLNQTIRPDGSIRPMVFMQHGLMLAMWMGSSSLAGLAVLRTGGARRLHSFAGFALAAALVGTAFMCHSVGATVLLLLGLAIWGGMHAFRFQLPILLLVALVPGYMVLRSTGIVGQATLVSAISTGLEATGVPPEDQAERIESARTRFTTEDILSSITMNSPLFGLCNLGNLGLHPFVDPSTGENREILFDGLWIILFTTRGITGLAAWSAMVLLPILLFLRRHPAQTWRNPNVRPAAVLSLVLLMYTIDCLQNAMINPVYALVAGGLVGVPALRRVGLTGRTRLRAQESTTPGPGRTASPGTSVGMPMVHAGQPLVLRESRGFA